MARNDLGDRDLNWDCYGEDYARIVYDNGRYAMYGFVNGWFRRLTSWHIDKDEALQEFVIVSQGE